MGRINVINIGQLKLKITSSLMERK